LSAWHSRQIKRAAEHYFPCISRLACYLETVTLLEKERRPTAQEMLIQLMGIAMLAGLAGLVAFEIVAEVRGAGETLHDRYHE